MQTFVQGKKNKNDLIFLGIFAVFFGSLLIAGEPIYAGDTFQYENQMIMREPAYALLIQFLRFLSPEWHYRLIIIVQNVIAVLANTAFIIFMRRRFELRMPILFLFTAILLAPHIMTPLFSSKHLVLTNTLMTEGILFSLYPVAFISLLDMMWSGRAVGKESIKTISWFLLLSLIRGQMMVLFVVWFLVAFFLSVKSGTEGSRNSFETAENIAKRGLIAAIAIFTAAFMVRSLTVHVYNYCEQGLFVDTASGKAMSFANVLYVTEREDGDGIEDDELRALFYEMYDAADADKMNYKYAPQGVLNKALYHEKCHDNLNFIYFAEPARRYVGDKQGIFADHYQELMIAIDDVAEELNRQLMPKVMGKYALNYLNIIALGFVRTVAYEKTFLAVYTVFMYIAAIAFTVILWHRNPKSKAASFMAVVLITIVGNVCATALMIQCTSRYMMYNLPLFYMAGFLELKEIIGLTALRMK